MDLSNCTPGQMKAISTLDRPLMISAGAGSGKTFTLTQRIVNALKSGSIGSMEQVCAITYTNAAAAELRSRIKALLAKEGMHEQARMVDDAWISTIHSMAARMLRENALRIGIDPGFEVIGSIESDMLLSKAVDEAAAEAMGSPNEMLRSLVSSEPLFANGPFGRGVMDDVLQLLARLRAMPAGFEGIVLPTVSRDLGDVMQDMIGVARSLLEALERWSEHFAKDPDFMRSLEDALEGASNHLRSEHMGEFESFASAFYAFPHSSKYRKNKGNADLMEVYEDYRHTYAALSDEVACVMGHPRLVAIAELAKMVDLAFSRAKGPSRLDNDDLLRRCYEMLRSDAKVAAHYRDRFELVMIDEFQDTDRLQTAIISSIARPCMQNVCTVGDAQQSIYRFRGADVSVFREYERNLIDMNEQAETVELPDNFRSHEDVLKMVDAVFSPADMFGEDFLHLEAKGSINEAQDPVFTDLPRVSVDMVQYQRRQKGPSATSQDARRASAEHIARHFLALSAAGERAEDMALLLGAMSHAQEYADALRAVGLESRIVAGSVFQHAHEAQLVAMLLRMARNVRDEEALLQVLLSPMFSIGDDVLLAWASKMHDGSIEQSSLAAGFMDPDVGLVDMLSDDDKVSVDLARRILSTFAVNARRGSVAGALRRTLIDCGLLDRLQEEGAEGLSSAGNLEKACRLVERLQEETCGIAELQNRYCEHLRLEKENPGLLMPSAGDHVTIMTIHGSKGLEFPHVAVAELSAPRKSEVPFVAENIGELTYVAGKAKLWGDVAAKADALKRLRAESAEEGISDDMDAREAFYALNSHLQEQEGSEAKRLMYVGLTRAVRSVYLALIAQGDPKAGYGSDPVISGIYNAFSWPLDGADSVSQMDFGGSKAACVSFTRLPSALQADVQAEAGDGAEPLVEDGNSDSLFSELLDSESPSRGSTDASDISRDSTDSFDIPIRKMKPLQVVPAQHSSREDMFSYTSLSSASHNSAAQVLSAESHDEHMQISDLDKATDLGIAFHRLAQRSISHAATSESSNVVVPTEGDLKTQARICGLSNEQEERLRRAVSLWFSSAEAAEFYSNANIVAEVPFCVKVGTGVEAEGVPFYLVGEIDGLASVGEDAFLIDYKTGGSDAEQLDDLRSKHLLQARCYAFALLCSGYSHVRADFVRVERTSSSSSDQPQIVRYEFCISDLQEIEDALMQARSELGQ